MLGVVYTLVDTNPQVGQVTSVSRSRYERIVSKLTSHLLHLYSYVGIRMVAPLLVVTIDVASHVLTLVAILVLAPLLLR